MCLSTGSHDRAVLLYEYVGKKTVDLQHTEVPDAYRGRGIAKHLAKVKYKLFCLTHFDYWGICMWIRNTSVSGLVPVTF